MCRLPEDANEFSDILPHVNTSDGDEATQMTPRRSGRLKDKKVPSYNLRKTPTVTYKPPRTPTKKVKLTASPSPAANNPKIKPITLRLASTPERSRLTDELFDASVEELWKVHGDLCYQRAVLERRLWAVGEDINKLADVISNREKTAPVPFRGSKWDT
jgi:hypothetical protein